MKEWIYLQYGGILNTTVKLDILDTGCCYNFEKITCKNKQWKMVAIPALVGVLHHPVHGVILFDTGYGKHFFTASQKFPYRFYRWATPVKHKPNQSVAFQLEQKGIFPSEVNHIILSHFHGDHTGGLKDFPNATIYCSRIAYDSIKNKKGVSAVKEGYLPHTLPTDIEDRIVFLEDGNLVELPEQINPFDYGYDIFGDGSVVAVDIPGHAAGQIGVFINEETQLTFLCADSSWSNEAIESKMPPHPIAHFIMNDKRDFYRSFEKVCSLHEKNPSIRIIPTHCHRIWREMNE
ncbi:TPA: MBL fold metallo-hydrolase [Bacillus cereus]|nr:MBL fold metallo-hydrolase [Bacillus cereus]HDR8334377.1 MBL fold metallo-hydrolase [Bacillus cereus]